MITVRKGTICYGSELGHYNFVYPDYEKKYTLTLTIEVKPLPWIGYNGLTAVKVVSPRDYLPVSVVWVGKEFLEPK